MKLRLLDRVRCPTCAGRLELNVLQSAAEELVESGVLLCDDCRVWYPISRHVPVLLDFSTDLHTRVRLGAPRGRPRLPVSFRPRRGRANA